MGIQTKGQDIQSILAYVLDCEKNLPGFTRQVKDWRKGPFAFRLLYIGAILRIIQLVALRKEHIMFGHKNTPKNGSKNTINAGKKSIFVDFTGAVMSFMDGEPNQLPEGPNQRQVGSRKQQMTATERRMQASDEYGSW
jgi:hypothetical protein